MVAESGAVLLDDAARARADRAAAPARDGDHAQPPRGARARRRATRPTMPRRSPARCTRSARTSWCHRRPPRGGDRRALRRRRHPPRSRARATPTARPTARAARTPARSPRTWRSAARPLEAAQARARAIAAAAVRDGLRGIGDGAGPVDVLGLTDTASRRLPVSQNPVIIAVDEVPAHATRPRRAADRRGRLGGRRGGAGARRGVPPPARRGHVGGRARSRRRRVGARPRWCRPSTRSRATPTASSSSRAPRAGGG